MKLFNKTLIFLFISAAFLAGCDHDDTPEEPNLIDRFGPFRVDEGLSADRDSANFSEGETITFSAAFNKNVNWIIKIEGMESGSVKLIEGFDRFIGENNGVWDGGTTQLPLFREEECLVTLTVPEEDADYGDTLMVNAIGTKVYDGNLVADFETPAGGSIQLGDFEFELTPSSGRANDVPAAQGEYFYRLAGTDNESGGPTDNFFVGLAAILPSITGETYFQVPTTSPQNLYFNHFLLGVGSQYTRAIVEIVFDSNDNGQFDDGSDERVSWEVDPTYTGWRLQSTSLAFDGVTNEKLEKIVAIRLILISRNNIQPDPREEVEFGSDFMIFTQGGPLEL